MKNLFKKIFSFDPPIEVLSLNLEEQEKLKILSERSFDRLASTDQEQLLKLGAKDFSSKFGKVIKILANE